MQVIKDHSLIQRYCQEYSEIKKEIDKLPPNETDDLLANFIAYLRYEGLHEDEIEEILKS